MDRIIVSTGPSLEPPARPDAVTAEHASILTAIRDGDPAAAAGAARAHVQATLATLTP